MIRDKFSGTAYNCSGYNSSSWGGVVWGGCHEAAAAAAALESRQWTSINYRLCVLV